MKQHQGYEINFEKNAIIVTKSFLKEAGIVGSAAYSELACVRKDFPDYQIEQRTIAKKKGKQSYGELTYKTMAEHIEAKEEENAPIVLAQFERIKKLSKCHSGSYAFVKKWFLERYKDDFEQETNSEEEAQ